MKNIKKHLEDLLSREVKKHWPDCFGRVKFKVERSPEERYGDYSTNLALQLSAALERGPMEIGKKIVEGIKWPKMVERVEAVVPGFINIYLSKAWLKKQPSLILKDKDYFRSEFGHGQKVQIEFISANPTGPLHVGNGRGGFMGDCLANVMKGAGFKVQREYYINDLGKQTEVLAESVVRRYFQSQGIQVEYPDYCYQGEYIKDLAKKLNLSQYKIRNMSELKERIRNRALNMVLSGIKKVVTKKLKIRFDRWFFERTLYTNHAQDKILKVLRENDLIYEKEGAVWFKATRFGDDKDRVLIKNDGKQTYFLSDILYHLNKFKARKFDKVINIWGADHYGDIKRVKGAMSVFGYGDKLDILMVQLVRILKGGQELRMSKRTGTYITLEELVDEVGLDVARFFFLANKAETHMDFDMDLAKERSEKNPVYYVQYAHARICSIIRNADKLLRRKENIDRTPLEDREGIELIKLILSLPDLIEEISQSYELQKLPFFAITLATKFHDYYTKYRIIDSEKNRVRAKRLELIYLTKFALMKVLGLMGVSSPEKM